MKWAWVGIGILLFLSAVTFSFAESHQPAAMLKAFEHASPSDWIREDQILVYPSRVIVTVPNATWATFSNTNSMDPYFDETSNALEILPATADAIQIGDVISYQTSFGIVIHRVIEKGRDEQGAYFIVKGDNNPFPDPAKVRFQDIKGVVIAIIY